MAHMLHMQPKNISAKNKGFLVAQLKYWKQLFLRLLIICLALFSFACKKNSANVQNIELSAEQLAEQKQIELSAEEEAREQLKEKAQQDQDLNFWSDYPSDVLAEEIARRMTDEELLSQLFMFGWAGAEPSKLVTYWVEERHIGSIKIFGWNTDNTELVAKNITTLQNKAMNSRFKIPLYVATDQEGGWIRHVKGNTSDTPGNLAIGASGFPQDAFYSGYYIAKELRALGINMNFAPSVDLYTNHDSTIIGPRSFGENPEKAAVLAASFVAGTKKAGVIPTAKHFPGHGDTGIDSHGKLPVIDIDKETLFNRELLPFKYLIEEDIPAIMTGHLAFPQITRDEEPASLSKTFIKSILRDTLQFKGLVISDDMMMNGATNYAGGIARAVTLALEAGNNILCSSTTPQLNSALWTENIERMKTTPSFRRTVQRSCKQVLQSKIDYFKGDNFVPILPDMDAIKTSVPDPEGSKFFIEQACRSITFYEKGSLPIWPAKSGKVLLAAQFQEFFDEGVKRYPASGLYYFKYYPTNEEIAKAAQDLKNLAKSYDTIMIFVPNQAAAEIAQGLSKSEKNVIIISALSPVPVLEGFDWAGSIILTYSYSPFTFKTVFGAIAGDFEAQGRLPLQITHK